MINYTYMESPVGRLLLAGDEEGLRLIGFAEGKNPPKPESEWRYHTEPLQRVVGQLTDYFAGNLRRFDLPLQLRGTPFQLVVWGPCRIFHTGRRSPMASSHPALAILKDRARSGWPTDQTLSRLWSRVIV